MQLTVDSTTLNLALGLVSKACKTKTTLPSLATILVTATEPAGLTLAATDLTIFMQVQLTAAVGTAGELSLPGTLLREYVAEMSGPLTIATNDKKQNATLSDARNQAEIKGLAAQEFPALPQPDGEPWATLPAGDLAAALRSTTYAAADEDTARPAMEGSYWQLIDGTMDVVSADGYRMAYRVLPNATGTGELLVPGRAARLLAGLLKDAAPACPVVVRLTANRNQVVFQIGPYTLGANLLAHRYLDYMAIIPRQYQSRLAVNRAELQRAVNVAALFARQGSQGITLTYTPKGENEAPAQLLVRASVAEVGNAQTVIDCTSDSPTPNTATFKESYLSEALAALKQEELFLELNGPSKAGVMKQPGILGCAVLMPLQI